MLAVIGYCIFAIERKKTKKMVILIDNGHGSNTPGKRSPDGRLLEWRYTREIATAVTERLRKMGYDARRIVTEDNDIPLAERCRRVNALCRKYGTGNVVLISIHVNAAGNGQWLSARGWSAWTSRGQTSSDKLADLLYAAARMHLQGHKTRTEYSDGDADWEAGFYILKHTLCAAVLTENMFQDNRDDVAFLLSDEGRERIISTHVYGITNYCKPF